MGKPKPLTRDQVSGETQGIFDQLNEKYGLIPNAYGLMARAPEILKAYLPFRKAVVQQGVLEQKYKELVWLKASNVNGCQHWQRSHYASAKQSGLTGKQLKELPDYKHSKAYDEKEIAAINYADIVTRGASGVSEGVLEALGEYFSSDEIVEMTLMIGLANFNNRLNEALLVDMDVVLK